MFVLVTCFVAVMKKVPLQNQYKEGRGNLGSLFKGKKELEAAGHMVSTDSRGRRMLVFSSSSFCLREFFNFIYHLQ